MQKDLPQKLDDESLGKLAPEELVNIIIEQARTIEKLNKTIAELKQQVEKLKVSRDRDSKISSKPPSGDLLKKSEKKHSCADEEDKTPKRKPGGQPGHPGKTRKGFDRVDRFEILRPQLCECCGKSGFSLEPIKVEIQQVARARRTPNIHS